MSERKPQRLFHWTCDHGEPGIRESGTLLPLTLLNPRAEEIIGPEEAWRAGLIWLTDLEHLPDRESLGLTMFHIFCDRTAHRFEVDPSALGRARWWPSWCSEKIRGEQIPASARDLSLTDGARPAHWFVARGPLPVLR